MRGFAPPSWHALAAGARPEPREPDDYEPGSVRTGWQHEVASRVEEFSGEDLFTATWGGCEGSHPISRWPRC